MQQSKYTITSNGGVDVAVGLTYQRPQEIFPVAACVFENHYCRPTTTIVTSDRLA
jgi:hypothetical protein